jgi:hypothetical protein
VRSAALALVMTFLVGGCGIFAQDAEPSGPIRTVTPGPSLGWAKLAGLTSCLEWATQMTLDERSGLANAILDDPADADYAVVEVGNHRSSLFADAISRICEVFPKEKISTIALGILTTPNELFPNCRWDVEPADRICGPEPPG